MTFGALTFLSPWLLAALAALPLIYWLLRAIPPRPKRIEFPPTRILKDVEDRERTPAKTPWWLLLIRLLAAALIIVALAQPVLNPSRGLELDGNGPLAIIIDNGWASADDWQRRITGADLLITSAQNAARSVIVLPTATTDNATRATIMGPGEARALLRGLMPHPFPPDLAKAVTSLKEALANASTAAADGVSVAWLTDGIAHSEATAGAIADLAQIASSGTFAVIEVDESTQPLALAASVTDGGNLNAIVKRTGGGARAGSATAYSARGENLTQATFQFAPNETQVSARFEIPLELRNQVARIAIDGTRSAGTVHLLDARAQWRRVALISSEGAESAQPLLAPLYYLEKALAPYAQLVKHGDANLLASIDEAIAQNASVIIMADIGTLSDEVHDKLASWVNDGGVLIRFAGPRMEKASDDLLPVPLRLGGRTLGGALSWSTPQQLAEFEDSSPFAGLETSSEITVSRQVLADPARLPPTASIWARLVDGTPLVTAAQRGSGQLVLFHITANSDWSNLPISGLFVAMLKRVLTLGVQGGTKQTNDKGTTGGTSQPDAASQNSKSNGSALLPIETLNGFGDLGAPPPTAQAIPASDFEKSNVSPKHPPGYYGSNGAPRALNIATEDTTLSPLPALPANTTRTGYGKDQETLLKPWLLLAALALVFIDILAVLLMQGIGAHSSWRRTTTPRTAVWFALAVTATSVLTLGLGSLPASAQTGAEKRPLDRHAQQATNDVTFGFVLTGDANTDTTSELGLRGLARVLARRTSVTPGPPIGVDIVEDEIAFYPILYWPIIENAKPLPESVLAKIDAYMKQGGLVIFDTKDFGSRATTGFSQSGNTKTPLQRLLGKLDIPRLEPVPPGHVLTKSFYLLRNFPGRWAGGQLWVEAGAVDPTRDYDDRRTTSTDGVTSIMITPNDFAAAWAMDERGRPLYPTVSSNPRHREFAFRTGINIVMHALTGNYKADQVHVPSLLQRLGQ